MINKTYTKGQRLLAEDLNAIIQAVNSAETLASSSQSAADAAAESAQQVSDALEAISGSDDLPAATIAQVTKNTSDIAAHKTASEERFDDIEKLTDNLQNNYLSGSSSSSVIIGKSSTDKTVEITDNVVKVTGTLSVNNKSVLTEHQDISGKQDKLTRVQETVVQEGVADIIVGESISDATIKVSDKKAEFFGELLLNNKAVLTEHQDISGKQDKLSRVSEEGVNSSTSEIVIGNSRTDVTVSISNRKTEFFGDVFVNGSNILSSAGSVKDLSDKTMVVFGDSAAAENVCNWVASLGTKLGVGTMKNFAIGGSTWRNRWSTETGALVTTCIGKQINNFESWAGTSKIPDIILFQIGGNDLATSKVSGTPQDVDGNTTTVFGSVDAAFKYYNYNRYKNSNTSAECIRYYLEKMRRKYPNALIIVGTVFQRIGNTLGTTSQAINDVLIEVCHRLCIQMIDGEKYLGFSPLLEPHDPYYCDANSPVSKKNDRSNASRTNPCYNFINNETGEDVEYEEANDADGILKDGYSKRYGMYTVDGTHANATGDTKILNFMYNEIIKLI